MESDIYFNFVCEVSKLGFENLEKADFKSFRVSIPVADYEVLKKLSAYTGFDIGYLVRYVVHEECKGFLEAHPEFKV